jgi:hypothetical protein
MTEARNLEQAIRARSAKTGERYTAARAQVLAALGKRGARAALATKATPPPPSAAAAVAPGLSGKAVLAKTGQSLDHWFEVLDQFKAADKGHTAAARHLREDHGVPGWHSQGITVAYERSRGLRAVNQAASGFQVAVSKMVAADLESVLAAMRPSARKAWLSSADAGLRGALDGALTKGAGGILRGPKRSRVRYKWEETGVELVFEPRGKGTSVVASNTKLRDAAQVTARRAQWRAALDALKAHLDGRGNRS